MTRKHKTLETLLERAERRGYATNGKWTVKVIRKNVKDNEDGSENFYTTWTFEHHNTEVLMLAGYETNAIGFYTPISPVTMLEWYGQSKSDADGLNAMCDYFRLPDRFTFRPVNGGFIKL